MCVRSRYGKHAAASAAAGVEQGNVFCKPGRHIARMLLVAYLVSTITTTLALLIPARALLWAQVMEAEPL
jgi:hypothetical protein